MGWEAGCLGGSRVVECMHPGAHVVPAWAPAAAWSFMRAVDGRGGPPPTPPLPPPPPPPTPPPPPPSSPPAQAGYLLMGGLLGVLVGLVGVVCLVGVGCRRRIRRTADERQRSRARMILDDSAQAHAQEEACTSSTGGRGMHNGHGASGRSLTPPFAREDSEANMFSVSIEMAPG